MKQIKTYIQYPLNISECSYYKYLILDPPKNVKFVNPSISKGIINNKTKRKTYNLIKHILKTLTRKFNLSLSNSRFTKTKEQYDLIHCAHCLSLNDSPWVADFEWVYQVFISGVAQNKKKVLPLIESPYCKKILCWTKATQEGVNKIFPEIKHKTCVVYPATPETKIQKIKHKGINLLYVSRLFYEKGGLHALEVMDRLTKKYKNVYATLISQIPSNVKQKYSSNKKLKIMKVMPQERLFKEIHPKADIFIYPAYIDTFGFAMTEAFSFGLPVVSVEGFSRKEIIHNGKTGFVVANKKVINYKIINENIINKIVDKTSLLIENNSLRKSMSNNCFEVIKNGKFSIKERNKQISKIYQEALK